jgi:hypothetical protein
VRQIVCHYIFIPGNMIYSKIIKKGNNFQASVKIYAFKDPSRHWKVPAICFTTNNKSPTASSCFMPMKLRICRPNRMLHIQLDYWCKSTLNKPIALKWFLQVKLRQSLHIYLPYMPNHQRTTFMDELTLNYMIHHCFDQYNVQR